MTQHHFEIEHAKQYGVDIAIIINNFEYWLQKNRADNRNIHDGRVWTYNSVEDFTDIFPYWDYSQIRRRLDKMEKLEILLVGNFNKKGYDRTKWYTLNPNKNIMWRFCQMDSPKSADGFAENSEPIPTNNTTNNTDRREDKSTTTDEPSKIPTRKEWLDYFKENGYHEEAANKSYDYYNASVTSSRQKYWRDGKDNLIKNWKMKARSVWFKDENKIKDNQGNDIFFGSVVN